jgi:hypothetical protein
MAGDRMETTAADGEEPARRADRAAGPNRHCMACGVRLSVYNPGPHCWNHTIGHPWRGPSAKPKL